MKLTEKQKQERKKRLKKRAFTALVVISLAFIIYFTYCAGMTRGLITGTAVASEHYNSSLCDFMGKERDIDGFCILAESEYRLYLDCGYEKFKLPGEKRMSDLEKLAYLPQRIFYYPIMGC